ncbi:protein of unknown function [Ralstonia solanacearum CMR15]|nr:protein of unknown function [Ralstonia solanacearum CMR15]
MTQSQLQQMFRRARIGGGGYATNTFGDHVVTIATNGQYAQWYLNGSPVSWDHLQSLCDDY